MQAILTRYLPITSSRGSRIKAIAAAGSVTIPYPHELDTESAHRAAALALRERLDWTADYYGDLATGQLPSGDYCHVFVKRG